MIPLTFARKYFCRALMAYLLVSASFLPVAGQEKPAKAPVLLLPFKLNSASGAPELAAQVFEILREELSKNDGIVILKGDTRGISEPNDLDLKKLAVETKAAFLVYGSVTVLAGNYSLDARLLDGVQGEFSSPLFVLAQGNEELAKGVQKLAGQLAGQILSSWSQMPEAKLKAYYGEGGLKGIAASGAVLKRESAAPLAKAPVRKEEPAQTSEIKVGLLPFKVNASPDTVAPLAEVWEALARELAVGGQMTIVGKGIALELLNDPAKIDHSEEAVRNFAQAAKADYIVYGTVTQLGQALSLDSRIFHNVPGGPFTPAKVYVDGSGQETILAKVKELAFELKRNILKGKIIVTPLPAESVIAGRPPVAAKTEPKSEEKVLPLPTVPAKPIEPGVIPKPEERPAETKVAAKAPEKQDLSKSLKKSASPISITARSLEADNRKGTVTFKGQVVAKKDDYTLTADVMVASYGRDAREIKEITAQGRVKMTQGERVAVAQKAIFYNEEQKVVLTQGAKVWQGKNEVSGEVITVFLQDDRMIVEGGEKEPVSAIIFPTEDGK